jgi:hypothetical protein
MGVTMVFHVNAIGTDWASFGETYASLPCGYRIYIGACEMGQKWLLVKKINRTVIIVSISSPIIVNNPKK